MRHDSVRRTGPAVAAGWLLAVLLVVALAAPAAAEKCFLWRAEGPEGVVFLLGSLHLGSPDLYPLGDVIEDAYHQADTIMVEADMTGAQRAAFEQTILTAALYPPGDTLSRHVSPRIRKQAEIMGVELDLLDSMRPWMAALALELGVFQAMGFEESLGIEAHFLKQAREDGKQVLELEGFKRQLDLFISMPDAESEKLLYHTLLELDDAEAALGKLIDTWKRGDAEAFEKLFFAEYRKHPDLGSLLDTMITRRNAYMIDRINALFQPDRTALVIVGAGHLVGPEGLLVRMERQGWHVSQPGRPGEEE